MLLQVDVWVQCMYELVVVCGCVGVWECSSKQEWQVMESLEVMQRNVGASRQRRILFWTLMRQRVFATEAEKLPPPPSPATSLSLNNLTLAYHVLLYLHETFTYKPSITVTATSSVYIYKPSLLTTSALPTAMFIAIAGDRGDLRPSNVMSHCTTRY